MGKRKELVDGINKLLGTKFELRGVSTKDLEELHGAISAKLENLTALPVGQNIQGLLDTPLIQVLKKRLADKKLEDLTIGDLVSTLQEGAKDKGILGLGILPRLLGSRRRK